VFEPRRNVTTTRLFELESMDGFATFVHPKFPHRQIKVKIISWSEVNTTRPTLPRNACTRYLGVDAGAKHLFFYFFESRCNPNEGKSATMPCVRVSLSDVVMQICGVLQVRLETNDIADSNPNPACSSSLGLLVEIGPCRIDMNNTYS